MRKKRTVTDSFDKIKGRMCELRITQRGLAKELGISIVSLNKKLNGILNFTWEEMEQIISILGITENEIADYFFADVLRKRNKTA